MVVTQVFGVASVFAYRLRRLNIAKPPKRIRPNVAGSGVVVIVVAVAPTLVG